MAPNVVMLGMQGCLAVQLLVMVVQAIVGGSIGVVFMSNMLISFFQGNAAGVFGNSTGR